MATNESRISADLAPADVTTVLSAVDDIESALPFLITLTKDERRRKKALGPIRVGYVTEVSTIVKAFPSAIPDDFPTTEFNRGAKLMNSGLFEIQARIAALNEKLTDTVTELGTEMYTRSNMAYKYLKTGAENDAALKTAVDKIGKTFEGQGKKPAAKGTGKTNTPN